TPRSWPWRRPGRPTTATSGSRPGSAAPGPAATGSRCGSSPPTPTSCTRSSSAAWPGRPAAEPATGRSAAGEGGLARTVLEEREHPGPGVVGAEHLGEELLLEVEPAAERDVEAAVDRPLGQALGDDGAPSQLGRVGEGAVEQLGGRDHLVDETHGQG